MVEHICDKLLKGHYYASYWATNFKQEKLLGQVGKYLCTKGYYHQFKMLGEESDTIDSLSIY
jgi:hypothetical protein